MFDRLAFMYPFNRTGQPAATVLTARPWTMNFGSLSSR
jgi:hypothetical protein